MKHHSYTDDTQAYNVLELPSLWSDTSGKIAACVEELEAWMNRNMLKINQDKFIILIYIMSL